MDQVEPIDDRIIDLISTGNWEQTLFTLTEDMDPWNIDIIQLNRRFMRYIKQMAVFDFKIPAKIILAAAILYRMKCDRLKTEEEVVEDLEEEVDPQRPLIHIPPMSMPLRRKPARKVTLDELIGALGKAMTIKNRRKAREVFQIQLSGADITERIEQLYSTILKFLDTDEIVKFSKVIESNASRDEKIKAFNSLLHLSNQERVFCSQEELFGEIYLSASPFGV